MLVSLQLIHDINGVSEAIDWSDDATTIGKFRALRCHLASLEQTSSEFQLVERMLTGSGDNK